MGGVCSTLGGFFFPSDTVTVYILMDGLYWLNEKTFEDEALTQKFFEHVHSQLNQNPTYKAIPCYQDRSDVIKPTALKDLPFAKKEGSKVIFKLDIPKDKVKDESAKYLKDFLENAAEFELSWLKEAIFTSFLSPVYRNIAYQNPLASAQENTLECSH